MNLEYTEDELQDFDKPLLLKIAENYNLKIGENTRKLDIIQEILDYQNDRFHQLKKNIKTNQRSRPNMINKFDTSPADIMRLLGLYLPACDIVYLCRLNKKINNIICQNRIFSRDLAHLRLTDVDERLQKDKPRDILKDINNKNPKYAAENGYLQQIKYFISHGLFEGGKNFAVNIAINYKDMIDIVAKKGYIDLLQYLLFEQTNYQPKYKFPVIGGALSLAAGANQLAVVKYLISKGADIHAAENQALILAAAGGHLEMIKYLQSLGVDIHQDGDEALESAAGDGRLNVVQYLVENGPDMRMHGYRPLRRAAENGHLATVKYLVDHGANIHYSNDQILMDAAARGHVDIVRYLISQGFNIHTWDDAALASAASRGHLATVKYLVENGADIHDETLRNAARYNYLDVVKYLISQSANNKVISNKFLKELRSPGHTEMYEYLESVRSKK